MAECDPSFANAHTDSNTNTKHAPTHPVPSRMLLCRHTQTVISNATYPVPSSMRRRSSISLACRFSTAASDSTSFTVALFTTRLARHAKRSVLQAGQAGRGSAKVQGSQAAGWLGQATRVLEVV